LRFLKQISDFKPTYINNSSYNRYTSKPLLKSTNKQHPKSTPLNQTHQPRGRMPELDLDDFGLNGDSPGLKFNPNGRLEFNAELGLSKPGRAVADSSQRPSLAITTGPPP
jgi:hypothetical protein